VKHSEPKLTRRQLIQASTLAVAGYSLTSSLSTAQQTSRPKAGIPLIHITDLYHPPQDPDDHLDLLTVVALREFDLKGVILDVTQKFLEAAPKGFDISRDPGFVPVTQLAYLIGKPIPVAMGPTSPLKNPDDPATDQAIREQAGISMVIDILENSPQPVVISCTGSARVFTAAFNRRPDLVRSKVKAVLLNAGSTGGTKREWNVGLDLHAHVGLWRSGLPIHWYPCATERGAFDANHERGTYWKASHADLFKNLPHPLCAWIEYGFAGNLRGDIIRSLSEGGKGSGWESILTGQRNLWATVSLVIAAGRVLAHTLDGWRFIPQSDSGNLETWPWRLDSIEATVNEEGQIHWRATEGETDFKLFGRKDSAGFGIAMAEALNALLRSILG
jgi:hypothetical protein